METDVVLFIEAASPVDSFEYEDAFDSTCHSESSLD